MERLSTRSHLGGAGRAVVTSKRMLGMLQMVVVVALMTTVVVVGVMGDDSETVDVKIPRLIRRTLRKELGDTPNQNGSGWTGRQREDLQDLAKKARSADKTYRIAAPIFLASLAGGVAANYKARHAPWGNGSTGWNALALAALAAMGASGATAIKAAIDRVKVEKKFKQLAKVVKQYREQEAAATAAAAAAATAAAAEEAAEDASMADEAKPTSDDDVAPQEAALPEEVMTAAEYAAEALSGAEK